MNKSIRVVVLDADGVVQHTDFAFRERLGALVGGDVDADAIEAFVDDVFAAEKPAVVGDGDFREGLGDVLAKWRIGHSIDDVLAIWNDIAPQQAVLAMVDELRAHGLRVCLATNQHRHRAEYMDRALGYRNRFNQSFYSYQIGSRKPDALFFQHMVRALACDPDEILFIDDHPDNVAAAQAFGLRAVRFDTLAEPVAQLRELIVQNTQSVSQYPPMRGAEPVELKETATDADGASTAAAPSASPVVLALRDLHKSYPGVEALNGVNLTVNEGQVYGFLGRNGAGKSTAMNIVMGITHASSGAVELFGENVERNDPRLRQRVGYVAQEQHFYGWMNTSYIGRFVSGFYPTWDDAEYQRLLKQLDVPSDRKLQTFSGGMHAKLALALALAHRPPLLLLDEPTAGMDAVARREFIEIVHDQAARANRTTVFSSHLIDEVEAAADTVGIVDNGRMLYEGSLDRLRQSVKRLVCAEAMPLPAWLGDARIIVLRDRVHDGVREVVARTEHPDMFAAHDDLSWRIEQPSLEEIFVAMVTRPI